MTRRTEEKERKVILGHSCVLPGKDQLSILQAVPEKLVLISGLGVRHSFLSATYLWPSGYMLLDAFTGVLPFLLSVRMRECIGLWGSAECLEPFLKCWVWQSTCYVLPSAFPHHFKPLCVSKEILPTCLWFIYP